MSRLSCLLVLLLVPSWSAGAPQAGNAPALTVVNSGPTGEVASLVQANEIRVVFSEPMVALGQIPDPVRAPFFKIAPAVAGTFRWSGTTILIFTPDPKKPLPFATQFIITIDTSAAALSGRRLARPFTFRFTTPTVKLVETHWYRRGGQVSNNIVVLLRFNQPVRATAIESHLKAALHPHDWSTPAFSADEQARLRAADPQGFERFIAKVRATEATAGATAPVPLRQTSDWDRKTYPPSSNLVVLETSLAPQPESWIRLVLDAAVPSPAGRATPGVEQAFTIEAERAFFIDGFECRSACDPDAWNPVRMRAEVVVDVFASAVDAIDITTAPERPVSRTNAPRKRQGHGIDQSTHLTLEDAGYDAQPPVKKYLVRARADLRAADGQVLGYPWLGIVETWHRSAFTSFGDGHGVWEKDGGPVLPFYARNFRNVTQWTAPIDPADLMRTIVALRDKQFALTPQGTGTARTLPVTADRIQSHGLDLSSVLKPNGTGIAWAAVKHGSPIARARTAGDPSRNTRATVVQVTNLGITVKDSPQNTLLFVTRLDTGAPVAGAAVSLVRTDSSVAWRGTTGPDGIALAPNTPLRDPDNWWKFAFIAIAEKDGDVAYAASDWNEGISPWDFGTGVNLNEAGAMLRGSVFTDRGVYRPGEEVHFKAILRQNTSSGIRFVPAGTPVIISVRDAQYKIVDERTVRTSAWSSAEWTFVVPPGGTLGSYSVRAILQSDKPKPRTAEQRAARGDPPDPVEEEYVGREKEVRGSFLVAAYRRPDFRVDVTLTGASPIAGDPLTATIAARYLFGAQMGARPVAWRFSKSRGYQAPASITKAYPEDQWLFVGRPDEYEPEQGDIRSGEQTLAKGGALALTLPTLRAAAVPYTYTLEADVEDVSRQHIANRASLTVHPAPWYIGLKPTRSFVDRKTGVQTQVIAVGLDGQLVAGVPVEVTLTQIQWQSVRRATGNGFYTWDSERKELPAGTWTVTTATEPLPLSIPLTSGGYFTLSATGKGSDGRTAITQTAFYVAGEGYTAWERYDHNRIDIVPERKTYKPGETARLMIQSPWEQATAILTTEREGIRSHRQFALTSTQQSVSIDITEQDIPNLYVSITLIKGRSKAPPDETTAMSASEEASDPGKPAFRMGYAELNVEDASKRLTVTVAANREEYRPATSATVTLNVKDPQGRGTASEVTLWAVDYGVLSLTDYRTPDILSSVYVHKALQVFNADSRQRIVSRRVLTEKGATEGGGGGLDAGAGTLRKDFRVLAFWLGSVETDAQGRATVDVKLPESLTTYRIMAVAADRASRFGSANANVRVNKPLTLKPTFPRFMAVGDTAFFGAVITNQLPSSGAAVVTMKSLDPAVLTLTAPASQTLPLESGNSIEARFTAAARAVGRARVQMTVRVGDETDAFEDVIPVEVLVSPETVAAYGEATGALASESLKLPASVVPGFGGLHVEMASTAMVGLGEGARFLVEYPYGCSEQKGSRALALILSSELGDAFSLPGLDPASMKPAAQQTIDDLGKFQCGNGGFAYWPGACRSVSPYLTSYLLHVMQVATSHSYRVDAGVRGRALSYLEQQLGEKPPENEGWWPSYTAWQAFAIKVLVEGGRNQDSNINRVYGYRERMPVFGLAYLHDALMAKGETTGPRVADLRRRLKNAILPEGGSAHVEELDDPYLAWFWNSNVRSTAIVLNSLVRSGVQDAPVRQLVRWMMAARKDGRWGNTQENAHAMEALASYYRKFEATPPDFIAVAKLGAQEIARHQFKGRTNASEVTSIPMTQVLAGASAGSTQPLTFAREGTGTLFYMARLRYAADQVFQEGLDSGLALERSYAPFVEKGTRPPATSFKAGDLVRVTLTLRLTKERRFVALTDPLPAGFEPVESWFVTTARTLAAAQDDQGESNDDWQSWWRRGGFDHVERHDDRIELFATRLSEGVHQFTYIVRATTVGTFRTAPARAEEMYEPEVFGRTATDVVEVKR